MWSSWCSVMVQLEGGGARALPVCPRHSQATPTLARQNESAPGAAMAGGRIEGKNKWPELVGRDVDEAISGERLPSAE